MAFKIDKNLRKNQKHVHNSYLFHCDHCGFEDDIYVGSGFAAPIVFDETVKRLRPDSMEKNGRHYLQVIPKHL